MTADFTSDKEDPILHYVVLDYRDGPELLVQFIDLSTGNISAWEWNFDANYNNSVDRTYYESTNPIKEYPAVNATYDVSLAVTHGACTHTVTREDYIHVTGCPT